MHAGLLSTILGAGPALTIGSYVLLPGTWTQQVEFPDDAAQLSIFAIHSPKAIFGAADANSSLSTDSAACCWHAWLVLSAGCASLDAAEGETTECCCCVLYLWICLNPVAHSQQEAIQLTMLAEAVTSG